MAVVIDDVRLEDWQKIKNLRLKSLKTDPQAFGKKYEEEFQKSDFEWKMKLQKNFSEEKNEMMSVARDGKNIVGMIGAYLDKDFIWIIKSFYVDPDFRGQGIGKKLFTNMNSRIDLETNAKEVRLLVNITQNFAVELYKSLGFEASGRVLQAMMGDGKMHEEYLMRRFIARD